MSSQEYIRRDEFIKLLQEYIQELRIDLKGPTGDQGPPGLKGPPGLPGPDLEIDAGEPEISDLVDNPPGIKIEVIELGRRYTLIPVFPRITVYIDIYLKYDSNDINGVITLGGTYYSIIDASGMYVLSEVRWRGSFNPDSEGNKSRRKNSQYDINKNSQENRIIHKNTKIRSENTTVSSEQHRTIRITPVFPDLQDDFFVMTGTGDVDLSLGSINIPLEITLDCSWNNDKNQFEISGINVGSSDESKKRDKSKKSIDKPRNTVVSADDTKNVNLIPVFPNLVGNISDYEPIYLGGTLITDSRTKNINITINRTSLNVNSNLGRFTVMINLSGTAR